MAYHISAGVAASMAMKVTSSGGSEIWHQKPTGSGIIERKAWPSKQA
jgi:hypothetical protein